MFIFALLLANRWTDKRTETINKNNTSVCYALKSSKAQQNTKRNVVTFL